MKKLVIAVALAVLVTLGPKPGTALAADAGAVNAAACVSAKQDSEEAAQFGFTHRKHLSKAQVAALNADIEAQTGTAINADAADIVTNSDASVVAFVTFVHGCRQYIIRTSPEHAAQVLGRKV